MGCNFYLPDVAAETEDDPARHIGKRSAAGGYCWDCGVTLCKGGEARIHYTRDESEWFDACPKCGAVPVGRAAAESARLELFGPGAVAGRDRTGVRGVSSFIWAQDPEGLPDDAAVEDEYGQRYTMQEFRDEVLRWCPIQFTDSIGHRFS